MKVGPVLLLSLLVLFAVLPHCNAARRVSGGRAPKGPPAPKKAKAEKKPPPSPKKVWRPNVDGVRPSKVQPPKPKEKREAFTLTDEKEWSMSVRSAFQEASSRPNVITKGDLFDYVLLSINPDKQAVSEEEKAIIAKEVDVFFRSEGVFDDSAELKIGFLSRGKPFKFVQDLSRYLKGLRAQ